MLIAATVIWLRNRDILSDLYDYSSMIAAAGKIEAGLKPYTDFRSTMQSACYVLPRWVELVAGRNYLGLTWGGLALSLGGCLAIFGLLRRRFGPVLAALVAGAFTLAGFAQHVIIFYNPLGLLCLAIVTFGLIAPPGPRVWRQPRAWLILIALVIGGANKINFQALTLGLGGLLVLRAAVAGEIGWQRLAAWWAALIGFGLVVPIGLELWWTGATPRDWYFNIVTLAEARVGFIPRIFALSAYLKPTYAIHKHVLFPSLHTMGLAGLLVLVVFVWRRLPATAVGQPGMAWRQWGGRGVLLALALAAGVGGVLLTITNIEIITLTSLGLLVGMIAVAGAFDLARHGWARAILSVAAGGWLVVGGYAAWVGARVLYGRESLDRSTFVRLVHPPRPLEYLRGVRLDAGLRQSLLLTAKELATIRRERGTLAHVLFGPTLEWLERDSPEAILRGMPVWYDLGTSLRRSDGPWLRECFASKQIDRVFLHPGWESWPADFRSWLHNNFLAVQLGPVVRLYEQRAPTPPPSPPLHDADVNPFALLDLTSSQIHLRTTQVSAAQPSGYHTSTWGYFFGTSRSWIWAWQKPARIVSGSLVAVAAPTTARTTVRWRIIADPAGTKTVLWTGRKELPAEAREFRAPFRVEPLGRTLAFEIEADSGIVTGWRDMRILDAGTQADRRPPPGLLLSTPVAALQTPARGTVWLRLPPGARPLDSSQAWLDTPFEAWMPDPGLASPWHATLEIKSASPWSGGVAPIIMILWSKGSRLEILSQFTPAVTNGTFEVQGQLPESGGTLGIIVRPVNRDRPLNAALRVVRWPE